MHQTVKRFGGRLFLGVLGVMIGLASGAVQAQGLPKTIPARTEVYSLPSLTLSDQQFLTGDAAAGKPVTVSGVMRVAQGTGKMPVVVLMHGSGGVGANIEPWTQSFNAMGVSTFVIDGFTGRGITATSSNQALLGRLNLILDIYRSLDILARHPRVDPDRIVLMGFSRGGQAALYAGLERFHKQWNTSGLQFAGYVPFYPDCATTYADDTRMVQKPIRIFHGTPDDYNPVSSCKAFLTRLKAAGVDADLTEYADAPHGFDLGLTGVSMVTKSSAAQSVRDCTIKEAAGGNLINQATGQPFSYQDACVVLGPHVGGNPAMAEQARKDVLAFVAPLLRLTGN